MANRSRDVELKAFLSKEENELLLKKLREQVLIIKVLMYVK